MPEFRATSEQWKNIQATARDAYTFWNGCILELRDRVEALEQANDARRIDLLRLTNAVANQVQDRNRLFVDVMPDSDEGYSPAKQSGSLVSRVKNLGIADNDARAMICEVAAWLREEGYPSSPTRLEREANQ